MANAPSLTDLLARIEQLELDLAKERGARAEIEKALERQEGVNHSVGRALVQCDSFMGHMASGGKMPHNPARLKRMGVIEGPDVEFEMIEPSKPSVITDRFGQPLNGSQKRGELPPDAAANPPVGPQGPQGS